MDEIVAFFPVITKVFAVAAGVLLIGTIVQFRRLVRETRRMRQAPRS